MKYFSYDPISDSFSFHKTKWEARAQSKQYLLACIFSDEDSLVQKKSSLINKIRYGHVKQLKLENGCKCIE